METAKEMICEGPILTWNPLRQNILLTLIYFAFAKLLSVSVGKKILYKLVN